MHLYECTESQIGPNPQYYRTLLTARQVGVSIWLWSGTIEGEASVVRYLCDIILLSHWNEQIAAGFSNVGRPTFVQHLGIFTLPAVAGLTFPWRSSLPSWPCVFMCGRTLDSMDTRVVVWYNLLCPFSDVCKLSADWRMSANAAKLQVVWASP